MDTKALRAAHRHRRAGPPAAPRLAAPEDGAVVPGEAVQLRWHAQEESARYRVQLATDIRFTMVLLDRQGLASTSVSVGQTLAPGAYFWRVAASSESDGEGAFSEARNLRVSPTAPQRAAPEVIRGQGPTPFWLLPLLPFLFLP